MKRLGPVGLPEVSQPGERDLERSRLAESGVLRTDESVVEQLSSDPSEIELSGQYRLGEPYSRISARELEELASSSFASLPLLREGDRRWEGSGWYEIRSVDVEPAHPNAEEIYEYQLSLAKRGTNSSQYRAIETNRRQADHEFGNDLDALVALPGGVGKVRWYDAEDTQTTIAEPVESAVAEFGDVDFYDLDSAPEGHETLIFETEKLLDATTDARVYDSRGFADRVPEDVREWQIVFSTDHEFEGDLVLDTGLLRLRLDEEAGTIEAETWDPDGELLDSGTYGSGLYGEGVYYDTDGAWSNVGLEQPAGTELFDVDITSIGMVRDQAQLTFDVDGELFALDAIVQRGLDDVLFDIPENEDGPIPAGIEAWLEPIASTTVVDPQAAKTLTSRSDVRR